MSKIRLPLLEVLCQYTRPWADVKSRDISVSIINEPFLPSLLVISATARVP